MDKVKKKMGRPTDNPRNQRLSLRIAKDEMEEINYCSKKLGIPKIEVVLMGVRLLRRSIDEQK